ncbi:ATP-binding protein [Acetobacteraceae bacterium H6797]|nr:ATP-binding protein [Acetobacteraceae bacterium H6797]
MVAARGDEFVASLLPEPDAVPQLLDKLESYAEEADLGTRAAHHLALICEEIVANVVMHGSKGEAPASFVEVRIRKEGPLLRIRIEDDGPAFDPIAQASPETDLSIEERDIGGLGIHFVRSLVRDLDYVRQEGRNCLSAVLDAS